MGIVGAVMTTTASRRAARAAAVVAAVASSFVAAPALADTPSTWERPEPMSTLTAVLIFVGGPLAIIVVITLLTLGPSLVRGDRSRRGVASWTEPAWFGSEVSRSDRSHPQLTGAHDRHAAEGAALGRSEGSRDEAAEAAGRPEGQTGGASARW
jgi:hypothetical protein